MFFNWLFKTGWNIHRAAANARSIVLCNPRSREKKLHVLQILHTENVLQLGSEKLLHLSLSSGKSSELEFSALPCFLPNPNSQDANENYATHENRTKRENTQKN